jgi:hypothetical protein
VNSSAAAAGVDISAVEVLAFQGKAVSCCFVAREEAEEEEGEGEAEFRAEVERRCLLHLQPTTIPTEPAVPVAVAAEEEEEQGVCSPRQGLPRRSVGLYKLNSVYP